MNEWRRLSGSAPGENDQLALNFYHLRLDSEAVAGTFVCEIEIRSKTDWIFNIYHWMPLFFFLFRLAKAAPLQLLSFHLVAISAEIHTFTKHNRIAPERWWEGKSIFTFSRAQFLPSFAQTIHSGLNFPPTNR